MNDKSDDIFALHILIVDDDEGYLVFCQRNLQRLKFDCTTALSPQAALALFIEALQPGREPFDVVITDMNMPGMSGLELLQQLGNYRKPHLSILMSATENLDLIDRKKTPQVDYYFLKTDDLAELIALLYKNTKR